MRPFGLSLHTLIIPNTLIIILKILISPFERLLKVKICIIVMQNLNFTQQLTILKLLTVVLEIGAYDDFQ